jgi:hypothetical protein
VCASLLCHFHRPGSPRYPLGNLTKTIFKLFTSPLNRLGELVIRLHSALPVFPLVLYAVDVTPKGVVYRQCPLLFLAFSTRKSCVLALGKGFDSGNAHSEIREPRSVMLLA